MLCSAHVYNWLFMLVILLDCQNFNTRTGWNHLVFSWFGLVTMRAGHKHRLSKTQPEKKARERTTKPDCVSRHVCVTSSGITAYTHTHNKNDSFFFFKSVRKYVNRLRWMSKWYLLVGHKNTSSTRLQTEYEWNGVFNSKHNIRPKVERQLNEWAEVHTVWRRQQCHCARVTWQLQKRNHQERHSFFWGSRHSIWWLVRHEWYIAFMSWYHIFQGKEKRMIKYQLSTSMLI